MRRSSLPVVLALVLAAAAVVATAPIERADAASAKYHVKECFASYAWGRIPLRYGDRHFGYRHIKRRRGYTEATRRLIRRTLNSYSTYRFQGNTIVFNRYRRSVVEVVVVGTNGIPGHAHRWIGIITAYKGRWDGKRRGNPPPLSPDIDPSVCHG